MTAGISGRGAPTVLFGTANTALTAPPSSLGGWGIGVDILQQLSITSVVNHRQHSSDTQQSISGTVINAIHLNHYCLQKLLVLAAYDYSSDSLVSPHGFVRRPGRHRKSGPTFKVVLLNTRRSLFSNIRHFFLKLSVDQHLEKHL